MNKVLVTGGAGFIGSHLAEKLLEDKNEVVVIDNLSSGRLENLPEGAKFIQGDLKDKKFLLQNVRDFDKVFHLAANPDVKTALSNQEKDLHENVIATHNLLEAMRENSIGEIIFTSTSTVYGEVDQIPTPEDHKIQPISLYGATKHASENLISAYSHTFDFKASIFRLANIIGARSDHGVIYDFVKKLKDDPSSLEVLGNGEQRKSYLHVEECVDAIMKVHKDIDSQFEVFNIGSEDTIDVTGIAKVVIDEFDCEADIKYTGGKRGWKGDVPEMLLDISKIKSFGWSPSLNSEESVKKTAKNLINSYSDL